MTNKQRIASLFGLLLICAVTYGQAPANTVLIGAEGTTIASTTGIKVVYQFGVGDSFEEVSDASYPLIVDCAVKSICDTLGGDPAPNVLKSIYAVEQDTPYTVTLSTGVVVNVPALASCGLSSTSTAPGMCAPYPGATAIATDGQMVAVMTSAAPVYLQYCQGKVCNAPFRWSTQPLVVGNFSTLGGPMTSIGAGTLYVLPSDHFVGIAVAQGPIKAVAVPAK